jgi:hypothetical protein
MIKTSFLRSLLRINIFSIILIFTFTKTIIAKVERSFIQKTTNEHLIYFLLLYKFYTREENNTLEISREFNMKCLCFVIFLFLHWKSPVNPDWRYFSYPYKTKPNRRSNSFIIIKTLISRSLRISIP